ncbi:MAG: hypothetical protein ACI85Q_001065 [Salibacteraceae bacterium]|jgi:hypothetical protein
MKKTVLLLALSLTFLGGFAQESDLDPKFASYMIETERRTVFVQNMNLNETDAKIFWPIYDAFELELEVIRKQGIENLKLYGEQYDKMTDDQATVIMKTMLSNEAKRTSIRKKYNKKITKALGGKVSTRFMQLDSIVSMVLKLSIYDELPLVGDMN